MISKDTILSIFNEKGTLLKWLQKLEKAYTGAELTNVEITQTNPLTAIFTFLFEDGSTVNSSPITLPQGPAGKDGVNGTNGADGAPGKDGVNGTNGTDGAIHALGTHNLTGPDGNSFRFSMIFSANGILKPGQIVLFRGDKTENGKLYKYVGERDLFSTTWKPWNDADWEYEGSFKGDPGEAGVGIESITTLGYRAGTGANIGYTETMLKAHMSDNTDIEFSAFAKDGIDNTQQLLTDIKIANLGKYNVFAENTNNYGFTYNDTSEKFKAKKFYLTNSSDTSSQSISISTSGATISSSKILYCVEKGRFLTNSEQLGKSETLTLIVFQKENLTITIS